MGDRFTAPWIVLALLQDWFYIFFLSVLKNFTQSPRPFKQDFRWPYNDISQLPQHSRVHPLRSQGLRHVQFVEMFPNWRFLHQVYVFCAACLWSWGLGFSPLKAEMKKAWVTLALSVFSVTWIPAPSSSRPCFSQVFFLLLMSLLNHFLMPFTSRLNY